MLLTATPDLRENWQNANRMAYKTPLKVLIIAQKSFFLGLLGRYKHFFIIFARKKQ